jgi:hypothetical protein
MHTKFWSENLMGRDHSEDPGRNGKIISEWTLGKLGAKAWTGFTLFRIGTNGRQL